MNLSTAQFNYASMPPVVWDDCVARDHSRQARLGLSVCDVMQERTTRFAEDGHFVKPLQTRRAWRTAILVTFCRDKKSPAAPRSLYNIATRIKQRKFLRQLNKLVWVISRYSHYSRLPVALTFRGWIFYVSSAEKREC